MKNIPDNGAMLFTKNDYDPGDIQPRATTAPPSDRPFALQWTHSAHHSGWLTEKSANLMRIAGTQFAYMHPDDASSLEISNGGHVRIGTDETAINLPVEISDKVNKGELLVENSFVENPVNRLLNKEKNDNFRFGEEKLMLLEGAIIIAKVVVIYIALLTGIAYSTYFERRVVARIQHRIGPNVTGPFGLLQPIADAIKMILKEQIRPVMANKFFYILAPMISFVTASMAIAVIPVGDWVSIGGQRIQLIISDLNIGILYILAVTSLGIYGIVLAGWSSNSKYPLLGGLRAAAQMISYEVSLGLGLIGVLLLSQTFSIGEIVRQQSGSVLNWYIFKQPVAFFVYFLSAMAETNRNPFDMPEAESELVAGYHTEYAGMSFGIFFLAEYANMITVSAIAASMFFGGWNGPFFPPVIWFLIKVVAFMFVYVWVRGTLPRLRYDQLMRFGWLVLFPIGILNVMVTALIQALQ